jgi:hypothetical protein
MQLTGLCHVVTVLGTMSWWTDAAFSAKILAPFTWGGNVRKENAEGPSPYVLSQGNYEQIAAASYVGLAVTVSHGFS